MNQLKYVESRTALISSYAKGFSFREDESLNAQFNVASASLLNYLPSIAFNRHEEIFKAVLLHKKMSILEQSSYDVLDFVETENLGNETFQLLKNKPTIICTFHIGSYRIINLFLVKNKIPFALVMGKDIVEKEGKHFSSLYNNLPGNINDAFTIIDAESSSSGLQMLRELKRGRALLLYIDGNTGAGTATTKNDNCCIINFLNQQLFARKGISFLAHVANVPIITVASYRKGWDSIRLHFFNPICPTGKDRNEFAEKTTQHIYDLVAPMIKAHPEQWEAWLYIHKVTNIVNSNAQVPARSRDSVPERMIFNSTLFGIFKINSIPFLLKKNSYLFYEIDSPLYDLLSKCNVSSIRKECFEEALFNQLYEQGVLLSE